MRDLLLRQLQRSVPSFARTSLAASSHIGDDQSGATAAVGRRRRRGRRGVGSYVIDGADAGPEVVDVAQRSVDVEMRGSRGGECLHVLRLLQNSCLLRVFARRETYRT